MRPVAVHEAPVQRCTLRTHMQLPDQCEEEQSFDVSQLRVHFQIHVMRFKPKSWSVMALQDQVAHDEEEG
eukprot:12201618-Karenia_brevis.AAC.1